MQNDSKQVHLSIFPGTSQACNCACWCMGEAGQRCVSLPCIALWVPVVWLLRPCVGSSARRGTGQHVRHLRHSAACAALAAQRSACGTCGTAQRMRHSAALAAQGIAYGVPACVLVCGKVAKRAKCSVAKGSARASAWQAAWAWMHHTVSS